MELLPDDIICTIALNLKLNDIFNLCNTSYLINNTLNESFFYQYSILIFSKEFWQKAIQRPVYRSLPLKTMKKELLRIHNFQNKLKYHKQKPWEMKDFYNYWKND